MEEESQPIKRADQSQSMPRQQAMQRQQTSTGTTTAPTRQREVTVPIAQEELQVGKREVNKGTTRLEKRIIQKPVEEQVQLRDEDVTVDRRSVDRPVQDPSKAFEEKTIEMTETREEPVISKRARVTGEVTLKNEAGQRTETIRDSVRQTDVDVIRPEDTRRSGSMPQSKTEQASIADMSAHEQEFRRNYDSRYANSDLTYEQVRPAYRFGYKLAKDPQYSGSNWENVLSEARSNWEDGYPGSWNRYKDAIHYGWQLGRQGRS